MRLQVQWLRRLYALVTAARALDTVAAEQSVCEGEGEGAVRGLVAQYQQTYL